jgi:hypothetical protein
MANELRIRQLAVGGLVEDNPLTAGATLLTSAGLAGVSGGVGTTQHLPIVLDPDGEDGAPEIAWVTSLAAGAGVTGATGLLRGQEGTTARQHVAGTPWVHGVTPYDVPALYRAKPVDGVTRGSSTLGAFSTAWSKAIPVGAGQNVRALITTSMIMSGNEYAYLALARGGTVIAKTGPIYASEGFGDTQTFTFSWVDESPGTGTVTYEVYGATNSGSTMTLKNGGSGTGIGATINAQCCMSLEVFVPAA